MINRYCTKRDINGNTYKLIIDSDKRLFARENSGFFHRSDFLQVSKKEYRRLIEYVINAGFHEINVI